VTTIDIGYAAAALATRECGVDFSPKAAAISKGWGTVFKLDTAGYYTVLYSFSNYPDGSNPNAGVIRDTAGNLYGTTGGGGAT
jgi:hypothetical protein